MGGQGSGGGDAGTPGAVQGVGAGAPGGGCPGVRGVGAGTPGVV